MPSHKFNDAHLVINSVDLSDRVRSVTLNYSADDLDDTNMGDDTHVHKAGLKDWSIDVEFAQDYAAGEVDATLFSLVGADAVAIVLRPDKTNSMGATNPEYRGNGSLLSYQPVGGAVGDLHTTSANFSAAGTLSRVTA
jgi:hypothetical protein